MQLLRHSWDSALELSGAVLQARLQPGSMAQVLGQGQIACKSPKHDAMAPCSEQVGALLAQAEGCCLDSAVEVLRWAACLAQAAEVLQEEAQGVMTLRGPGSWGILPGVKLQGLPARWRAACHAGASCHCAKALLPAAVLRQTGLEQVVPPAMCCLRR